MVLKHLRIEDENKNDHTEVYIVDAPVVVPVQKIQSTIVYYQIIIIIGFPIGGIVNNNRFCGVCIIVQGNFCHKIKYEFQINSIIEISVGFIIKELVSHQNGWLRIIGCGDIVVDYIVIIFPVIKTIIVYIESMIWVIFGSSDVKKEGKASNSLAGSLSEKMGG